MFFKKFGSLTLKEAFLCLTSARYRNLLKFMLMYGMGKPNRSKNLKFLGYKIIAPNFLAFIWQYKDIFADENLQFTADNNEVVIYDCGANIGISAIYFKSLYPNARIKAFEPHPENCKILRNNLTGNSLDDVQVIEKAVWINNHDIRFGIEDSDSSSILSEENTINVEATRLKEHLEKETVIDMLKIDIEGAEVDVIIDCKDSLTHVRNLFIEYHSFYNRKQSLDEILKILTDNDFRYFINPEKERVVPFVDNKGESGQMDMQLNIYAYRE